MPISKEDIDEILENRLQPLPGVDGVYTIGLVKTRNGYITIADQIRRADCLAQYLGQRASGSKRIAVIGAGFAGLTVAKELAGAGHFEISLFEKRHLLCPIQRGCEIRQFYKDLHLWGVPKDLHPEFPSWLERYDRCPVAELAQRLVEDAVDLCGRNRLNIYQSCTHLFVQKGTGAGPKVTANGRRLLKYGQMETEHLSTSFDIVILAVGFGIERSVTGYPATSYWRNDDRGQVALHSNKSNYLISGYGDGALNDLFRLKIYDYRPLQFLEFAERMLDEDCLKEIKSSIFSRHMPNPELKFRGDEADSKRRLISFFRNDNNVILHVGTGKPGSNPIEMIFEKDSMPFNRFIFFLLWKYGGVEVFPARDLNEAKIRYDVDPANVLIRHGPRRWEPVQYLLDANLLQNFKDLSKLKPEESEGPDETARALPAIKATGS